MTLRTLVLGGARSGKSAHAEGLVSATGPVSYLATGRRDPTDPDWSARIAAHVARRPAHWETVEITDAALLAELISDAFDADPTLLVDDLATWLTGMLDEVRGWDGRKSALRLADSYLDKLVDAVATTRGATGAGVRGGRPRPSTVAAHSTRVLPISMSAEPSAVSK